MRNTSFIINGGAGRVIAAIPALEKYHALNPDDDFNVLVYGWESLYWGHPVLQPRTFGIGQKGLFNSSIKHNRVVCPEPYMLHSYYTQKVHLIEAFDEEINDTTNHSPILPVPNLYLSNNEINRAKMLIQEKLKEKNKSTVVVFQPYGSGIAINNGRPIDSSARSFDVDDALRIIHILSKDHLVIYFGDQEFNHPGDNYSVNFFDKSPDIRLYMALISQANYFLGCDSLGQHIAYSFGIPGTVVMGGTFEKNVTYRNHFVIYRNHHRPVYSPIRLTPADAEFADRLNEKCMQFTDVDIQNICRTVKL